jgi:hypothetical protein
MKRSKPPDGEQAGWVDTVRQQTGRNEALEPGQVSRISQWGAGPETVEPMLKLHRQLAESS